jgi:hypothetical protein
MKEVYDFRLSTERALDLLGPRHDPIKGSRPGFEVYSAKGTVGDSLYCKMEEADRRLAQSAQKSPIAGWDIVRTYSGSEIEQAQLFFLRLANVNAAGHEYGTWYTDGVLNENCAFERKILVNFQTNPRRSIYEDNKEIRCALSSRQVGPLRIPFQKMRKGYDISSTWAGELIVSERFVKLIETGGFTGGKLDAIWNTGVESKSLPDLSDVPSGKELLARARTKKLGPSDKAFWSWIEEKEQLPLLDKALWEQMGLGQVRRADARFAQLSVQSTPLTVASKTLFGETPFRPGSGDHCKCSHGEVRGKRLLTPLAVIGSSWDGSDICVGDAYWSGRQGLFRPWRLLVVSKRLFDAMRQAGMKGFDFEIVEMV